jgi:hypothetical protein
MIFGATSFGIAAVPIEVLSVRVPTLDAVALTCDSASDLGLRNPWRRDSIFCWRNWELLALSAGAKARLVRSIFWESPVLTVNFDGRLTRDGRYELQCAAYGVRAYFTGLSVSADAVSRREREQVIQDWAKPERAQDLQGGSLGTLQIRSGDLALTSGAASLHERVVRRVQTIAGEFAHDPEYGLQWRLKGLLTPDVLQRLQSRLVAQIRQEPDVARCQVRVGQVVGYPDVVSVRVQADTVDGPLVISTEVGRA